MAEINKGKTTEGMSVVLISIDSVPSARTAVKKNLTSAQEFRCKVGTKFSVFMKCDFLVFQIVVHQNKCYF